MTMNMDKFVPLYMDDIVRLHGTPIFIVFDGDVIFIASVEGIPRGNGYRVED